MASFVNCFIHTPSLFLLGVNFREFLSQYTLKGRFRLCVVSYSFIIINIRRSRFKKISYKPMYFRHLIRAVKADCAYIFFILAFKNQSTQSCVEPRHTKVVGLYPGPAPIDFVT